MKIKILSIKMFGILLKQHLGKFLILNAYIKNKESCKPMTWMFTLRNTNKQGEKTAFRMGEDNSKWSNWQTNNLKNIQATPTAQFQKNKWPNQKMGQRTK